MFIYIICMNKNNSLSYFSREWEQMKKTVDTNNLQISFPPPPHSLESSHHVTWRIRATKVETGLFLSIVIETCPKVLDKLKDRVNPDCFLLIKDYVKETITIRIKMDLETHQKWVYYAYPFHPFVWHVMDVAPEEACDKWFFFISHIIELHNQKRQYSIGWKRYPVESAVTKTFMEDMRQFFQLFYERFQNVLLAKDV